jgi:hypothetical protein
MKTKYELGDRVDVPMEIMGIEIVGKGIVIYTLRKIYSDMDKEQTHVLFYKILESDINKASFDNEQRHYVPTSKIGNTEIKR